MKTIRTLLTGLAGLSVIATAAFAGPDTWRRPEPSKPATPRECCAGHTARCAPRGTCCDVKHSFNVPASGRGVTTNTAVLCNTTCEMPAKERGCCRTGCVH